MGKRGPAPKSRAERELTGVKPERAPDPEAAPAYPKTQEFPPPPEHMTADAKAMWSHLGPIMVQTGVLLVGDLYPLEQMCVLWGEFRAAPRTFTNAQHASLRACFAEFGLTPASRRRIASLVGKQGKAPPENRFSTHRKPLPEGATPTSVKH